MNWRDAGIDDAVLLSPQPAPGAVSEQFCEKRKLAEQRGEQPNATVAILNTSGMNDRVQQ
jgi:hypothetical protein